MLKHGSHLEQERITEPSPNQINTQVAVFLTNIHLKQDFARLAIQQYKHKAESKTVTQWLNNSLSKASVILPDNEASCNSPVAMVVGKENVQIIQLQMMTMQCTQQTHEMSSLSLETRTACPNYTTEEGQTHFSLTQKLHLSGIPFLQNSLHIKNRLLQCPILDTCTA